MVVHVMVKDILILINITIYVNYLYLFLLQIEKQVLEFTKVSLQAVFELFLMAKQVLLLL